MIFTILSHDRDAHVKDFSFLLDDKTLGWSVAPAYSLLYTKRVGGEHIMTIAGEDGRRPERSHMLELAKQVNISSNDSERIVMELRLLLSVGLNMLLWQESRKNVWI